MSDENFYYETTPYGVAKRGKKWAVWQSWWGKDISLHKSQEEAEAACVEEARRRGCLVRHRVKTRAAKREVRGER